MSSVFKSFGNGTFLLDSPYQRPTNESLTLQKGVYNLEFDEVIKRIKIQHFKDEFDFNFQLYPIDEDFINYVVKRNSCINKNMGILLNGMKGAGKSVVAKTISNRLNLPVLIVSSNLPGLVEFIKELPCRCVIFMDEFEKTFGGVTGSRRGYDDDDDDEDAGIIGGAGVELLPIMDGVYSGSTPQVFILTTNRLSIDKNLISRPGRILYSRTYNSLPFSVIDAYVADNLKDASKKSELFNELKGINNITIDVVRALVEEINVMDVSPKIACEYLNIEKKKKSTFSLSLNIDAIATGTSGLTLEEFKERIKKVQESEEYISSIKKLDGNVDFRAVMEKFFNAARKIGDEFGPFNWNYGVNRSHILPSDLIPGCCYPEYNNNVVLEVHEGGKYVKMVDRYEDGDIYWYYFLNPTGKEV